MIDHICYLHPYRRRSSLKSCRLQTSFCKHVEVILYLYRDRQLPLLPARSLFLSLIWSRVPWTTHCISLPFPTVAADAIRRIWNTSSFIWGNYVHIRTSFFSLYNGRHTKYKRENGESRDELPPRCSAWFPGQRSFLSILSTGMYGTTRPDFSPRQLQLGWRGKAGCYWSRFVGNQPTCKWCYRFIGLRTGLWPENLCPGKYIHCYT